MSNTWVITFSDSAEGSTASTVPNSNSAGSPWNNAFFMLELESVFASLQNIQEDMKNGTEQTMHEQGKEHIGYSIKNYLGLAGFVTDGEVCGGIASESTCLIRRENVSS